MCNSGVILLEEIRWWSLLGGKKGLSEMRFRITFGGKGEGGHSLMKVRYGGKGRVRKRNIFSVRFCRQTVLYC